MNQLTCCAVKELESTNDQSPEKVLDQVAREYHYTGYHFDSPAEKWSRFPGHIIFTGVVRNKAKNSWDTIPKSYSQVKLARYIKKHRLGRVSSSRANYNHENEPDHLVKLWVWCPAQKALRKWYEKRHPEMKILPPREM